MKKLIFACLISVFLGLNINAQIYTVGTGGDYNTLFDAFFDVNNANISGALTFQIISDITEYSTAELQNSGNEFGSFYTSILIYPTSSNLKIDGDFEGPLIYLNGAKNVIIDGRLNGSGTTVDLTLSNISASSSASSVLFQQSAQNNIVRYCSIDGAGNSLSTAVIHFSTATVGTGNDNNTIDHCKISGNSSGRPSNAIFSSGTTGRDNNNIIISNNEIFNFFSPAGTSNGVNLAAATTVSTVSDNSFYETASFASTSAASYTVIKIDNASGGNFTVTGNFIGGRQASCGGLAWTKTNSASNPFTAISVNAGISPTSNIQGNTIRNFSWANSGSSAWIGIAAVHGTLNIGTSTGNQIGESTGTGSITVTSGSTNSLSTFSGMSGIRITDTLTVVCQNNMVGSVTLATSGSTLGTVFLGISKSAGNGTTNISDNLIGSLSTPSSIIASSQSTGGQQLVMGIYSEGLGAITVLNNRVSNLTNNCTNTSPTGNRSRIVGIQTVSGTMNISNNIINNLTIANANNATNQSASVAGIIATGSSGDKTIAENTIYNLSNTYASLATGGPVGLFFIGSSSGTNIIRNNFIYGLSVNPSSTAAAIYGMNISTGSSTIANNIITLGGNTATTIYGINETGSEGTTTNFYFNTVYISGSLGSGITNSSFAMRSNAATNTRDFRNNIFVNIRSTSGGSNLHFALYILTTGGAITCDYNNYFVSGAGGTLGYYQGGRTSLPIVTSQDVNSSSVNPLFNGTGTNPADYQIGTDLQGVSGTGISVDFGLNARGANPTMGAWERTINKWIGTLSTNWNTSGNWSAGIVPGIDASIIFDNSPVNDLYLDANRSVTNVTNAQATYKLVTNGFKLTVKGTFILSNNAKVDASSSGSTVEFAGTAAQSIPAGAFVNNQVYNLTVNNSSNITFSGTLNILNNLTATAGALNAYTNSPTLILGGSAAQTIESGRLLSNRVANLTIDNSAGVTLNVNLTVDNVLSVTSSKVFTLGSSRTLTVNGSLSMTGGGQIDASATGTTLIFSGGSAQSIPSGAFVNNRVTNLTINNANNLILNGTLDLRGTFTTTAGRLDASTNSPTLILGGTTARGLDAVQFVNGTIHNLTIDNTAGVTLNSNLTVNNNLTINSSRIFTVSAGRVLTVTGTLTNNAGVTGLIIKSDVQGNDAKLLNNSTGVNATVEMAFTGGNATLGPVFHYFVPPVSSMSFDNSSIYNTGLDLSLAYFNGDLLNYSEVAAGSTRDKGWQYFDGYGTPSTPPFNTLVSSMGYNIHTYNNDRITFKGTLNGAAHSFGPLSFTNLGWNLVGNPYPCNYDLGGISHLTGTGDGVDNTVYFNRDGGYATWNVELQAGTTGYSNIMPPMQGFFVHATTTGQTLSLPTSSKTSSAAAPLRSKGGSALKKIKLVLNNGAAPDETIVCMPDKATDGFDSDYDAYKFTSSGATIPAIYSEMGSVKYALNAIEPPATGTKTIPLTVIIKADGTYKIDVTEFDNLSGYTVKLKHGTSETTLKSGTSYTFTAIAGAYKDFQLVIGVGTVDIEPVTTAFFTTWYSDSYLYIKCPEDLTFNNSSVAIFDMQGKVVYRNDDVYLEPRQTLQLPVALKEGIYITVIGNKVKKYTSKVVII